MDTTIDQLRDVLRCAQRLMLHYTRRVCEEIRADLEKIRADFSHRAHLLFPPYSEYAHEYIAKIHHRIRPSLRESIRELYAKLCKLYKVPAGSKDSHHLRTHLFHGIGHLDALIMHQFHEAMYFAPGYEQFQPARNQLNQLSQKARHGAVSLSLKTMLEKLQKNYTRYDWNGSQESSLDNASQLNEMPVVAGSNSGLSSNSTIPVQQVTMPASSGCGMEQSVDSSKKATEEENEEENEEMVELLVHRNTHSAQESRVPSSWDSFKPSAGSADDLMSRLISKLLADPQVQTLMQREFDQLAAEIVQMCGNLAPHVQLMLTRVLDSLTKFQLDVIDKVDRAFNLNVPFNGMITSFAALTGMVGISVTKPEWVFKMDQCLSLTQPAVLFIVFCACLGASVAMLISNFRFYKKR